LVGIAALRMLGLAWDIKMPKQLPEKDSRRTRVDGDTPVPLSKCWRGSSGDSDLAQTYFEKPRFLKGSRFFSCEVESTIFIGNPNAHRQPK